MIEHFNQMNKAFTKDPTPNPSYMVRMNLRAMYYLNSYGKKELAKNVMPKKLIKKMSKDEKQTYNEYLKLTANK